MYVQLQNNTKIVLIDMVFPSFEYFLKKYYPYEDRKFIKFIFLNRETIRTHFDSWLWVHGAIIRQKNKKHFLEFINEYQASIFVLKYLT